MSTYLYVKVFEREQHEQYTELNLYNKVGNSFEVAYIDFVNCDYDFMDWLNDDCEYKFHGLIPYAPEWLEKEYKSNMAHSAGWFHYSTLELLAGIMPENKGLQNMKKGIDCILEGTRSAFDVAEIYIQYWMG